MWLVVFSTKIYFFNLIFSSTESIRCIVPSLSTVLSDTSALQSAANFLNTKIEVPLIFVRNDGIIYNIGISFSYGTGNCTANGFSGLMNYNLFNFTQNHRVNPIQNEAELSGVLPIMPKYDNDQFMLQNTVVDAVEKRFHSYAT